MASSILNIVEDARSDPNRTVAGEYAHLIRLMNAMCEPEALAIFQNTPAGERAVKMIGDRLRVFSCRDAPDLDAFLDAMFKFTSHYKYPKHLDAPAPAAAQYDDPQ